MKVLETTIASAGLENGCVVCEVINGGKLSNKKGVNTPRFIRYPNIALINNFL